MKDTMEAVGAVIRDNITKGSNFYAVSSQENLNKYYVDVEWVETHKVPDGLKSQKQILKHDDEDQGMVVR